MLKIEITDPHTLPKQTLIDIATLLMKMGGAELLPDPRSLPVAPMPILPVDAIPAPMPILPSPTTLPRPLPYDAIFTGNPFAANGFAPDKVQTPAGEISAPIPPAYKAPMPKSKVDTDCNGLPWDARIHSRTKSKTAGGAWKLQRGVDMDAVGGVTKELEALMAIPAPAIPSPPVTQMPADPVEPPKETFATLMNKITDLVAKGKLNQAQVIRACQSAGVPSLPLVGTRPDLIPQISANIDLLIS